MLRHSHVSTVFSRTLSPVMGVNDISGVSGGPLRVCVTGPECTGKTTLALELARRYSAPLVREYAHEYFTAKHAQGDASVRTADILAVTAQQARLEDQAALWTGPLIICDTDVFTVAIWYTRYIHDRSPAVDKLAESRRTEGRGIDLYLLCAPDIPFTPDGLRSTSELRSTMYPVFTERLVEAGYRFTVISGTPKERLATAVEAIDRLCASSTRTRPRTASG